MQIQELPRSSPIVGLANQSYLKVKSKILESGVCAPQSSSKTLFFSMKNGNLPSLFPQKNYILTVL